MKRKIFFGIVLVLFLVVYLESGENNDTAVEKIKKGKPQKVTITGTLANIDPANKLVTITTPDGKNVSITITNGQFRIERFRIGITVKISCMEKDGRYTATRLDEIKEKKKEPERPKPVKIKKPGR